MSGSNPTINLNVTANVSQMRAQLQTAVAQLAALRVRLAELATAPSNNPQWVKQFEQLEAVAKAASAQVALLRAQIVQVESSLGTTGITASLTGRKLSALIDESIAGRWRQFDGTLASVMGTMLNMNPVLGASTAAVGLLAGAVAYLAYQWYEADKAQRSYIGGALQVGTLTPGTIGRVNDLRTQLRDLGNSNSDINKVVEAFRTLPPAAAKFQTDLTKIVIAMQEMNPDADIAKLAEHLAKSWSEGSKGVLKWAEAFHSLDPAQTQQLRILSESGDEIGTMTAAVKLLKERWVDTALAVAQARAAQVNNRDPATGDISGDRPRITATGRAADTRLPDEEQHLAVVLQTNKALEERAVLTGRIDQATKALSDAYLHNDVAAQKAAQEALATLEQKRAQVHTTSEQQQYEATLTSLQSQLAAERDHADRRVPILRQIAELQKTYHTETSAMARTAAMQVVAGEREAQDEALRITLTGISIKQAAVANNKNAEIKFENEKLEVIRQFGRADTELYQQTLLRRAQLMREGGNQANLIEADTLRAQIQAKRGNIAEQLQLEERLLQVLKAHWGMQSTEYQNELRHQNEMLYQQKQEQATIARQDAATQRELARLRSREIQAELKFDQGTHFKFPSMLELVGGQEDTARFKQAMQQLTDEHEQAMEKIVEQRLHAANPPEVNAAQNAALIENQRFANNLADAHRQAAQRTREAWTNVLQNMESGINDAVAGMLTGTRTLQQGMQSIFQSIVGSIVKSILKIPEAWINEQIASLFVQKTTNATTIEANAAVAASGAYAATAAIPIIGPELAMAAAMEAYGAVMGFEGLAMAAEGMWNIPRAMPVLVHPGETIMPEKFASGLRSGNLPGVGNTNNTSGDNNFTFSPTIHGAQGSAGQQLASAVRDAYHYFRNTIGRNGATMLPGRAF